jgi:hypothetical protein
LGITRHGVDGANRRCGRRRGEERRGAERGEISTRNRRDKQDSRRVNEVGQGRVEGEKEGDIIFQ